MSRADDLIAEQIKIELKKLADVLSEAINAWRYR